MGVSSERRMTRTEKNNIFFSSRCLPFLTIPLSVHGGSHSGHAGTVENDLLLLLASHSEKERGRDREREREKIILWETAHFGNRCNTVKTIRWLFSQFHSCVLPFGYAILQGNVLFLSSMHPWNVGSFSSGCWREKVKSLQHEMDSRCSDTKQERTKHLWKHR